MRAEIWGSVFPMLAQSRAYSVNIGSQMRNHERGFVRELEAELTRPTKSFRLARDSPSPRKHSQHQLGKHLVPHTGYVYQVEPCRPTGLHQYQSISIMLPPPHDFSSPSRGWRQSHIPQSPPQRRNLLWIQVWKTLQMFSRERPWCPDGDDGSFGSDRSATLRALLHTRNSPPRAPDSSLSWAAIHPTSFLVNTANCEASGDRTALAMLSAGSQP